MDCKEIQPVHPKGPEYSLEGLMLQLKFSHLGHLMRRVDSLEKTLMLGKNEGKRRTGQQRMGWLGGINALVDMNLSKIWEILKDRGTCPAIVYGVARCGT